MTTAAPDLSEKRFVFLVGAQRSGTTWLQLMLAATDEIATANETYLFGRYLLSMFEGWDALAGKGWRKIGLSHLLSEAEFFALVRSFCDGVFARMLARKPNATILLEKTPGHSMHWRNILKIYPDAYFIHLVRDPRAVVASMRAAKGAAWGNWASSREIDICTTWRAAVKESRQIALATDRFIEVRYEDLKSDCAAELRKIFTWMGLEVSAEACDRIVATNSIENLRSGKVDDAPWDLASEPKEFYRRGETDGWKHELSPSQIQIVEYMTRDLMEVYRYARSERPNSFAMALRLNLSFIRAALQWRAKSVVNLLVPRV